MTALVAIAIGAILGAWARWGLSVMLNPMFPTLPVGTLVSNLVGGYVIGVLVQYLGQNPALPPEIRLFAITGFLGSLTTFSTFSAESVGLLTRGDYGWALAHIGTHLGGSLLMTILGIQTVKLLSA